MTEKETQIIFDRFNQANLKISEKYGGTGLGLAIVKAYVEKLGGSIHVESEKDKGSTFHFEIPFKQDKSRITENISPNQPYEDSGTCILLVEDNPTNAFLVIEILAEIGANVLHAENGAMATELYIQNQNIELVLMDIKLGDTNGYDLTRKLKKIRADVPFIAQTAFALIGDKEKALEAGCIDHIAKPIEGSELIKKVKKYTSEK